MKIKPEERCPGSCRPAAFRTEGAVPPRAICPFCHRSMKTRVVKREGLIVTVRVPLHKHTVKVVDEQVVEMETQDGQRLFDVRKPKKR